MYVCGEDNWRLAVSKESEQFSMDVADGCEVWESYTLILSLPPSLPPSLSLSLPPSPLPSSTQVHGNLYSTLLAESSTEQLPTNTPSHTDTLNYLLSHARPLTYSL